MPGIGQKGGTRRQRPRVPRPSKPPLTKRPPPYPTFYTPPLGAEKSKVEGTLPERMVQSWLERNAPLLGVEWAKQTAQLGGRDLSGGAVVDFQIYAPVRQYWRVQGQFWHYKAAGVISRDILQRLALSPYGQVIDLYETAVYADVDGLCRDALAGIEHPPPESVYVPNRPAGVI